MTLIGLDIEGEWNLPLLRNAAEMNGVTMLYAREALAAGEAAAEERSMARFGPDLLGGFDSILACETGRRSRSIYENAAPRGRTALIVGNELNGIPRNILKQTDQVVSVPMSGKGMSSVNVAVAAAVALYAFQKDFGRKRMRISGLGTKNTDFLIQGADDPNELGSLFRSVWAFGWRKVFLEDSGAVWFTGDRQTKMAGRAAARQEKNPLVVSPADQLDTDEYDQVILCTRERSGIPLSRFSFPACRRPLIVYGDGDGPFPDQAPMARVYVDHDVAGIEPRYRHSGSILLSVLSELLRRRGRG